MKDARLQFPLTLRRRSFTRRGFTLTEVLIVVALILLVITLAIPAFNAISGGRSVDAAQNQIAAALARARQDAMGIQEPRGILFFYDVDTGRAVLAEVYYHRLRERSVQLELLPDREEMQLPVGVGCQVLPRGDGTATLPMPRVGVIMFDGQGRVTTRPYCVTNDDDPDVVDPAQKYNRLWRRLAPLPEIIQGTPNRNPPLGNLANDTTWLTTQFSVLLFDQAGFDAAPETERARFLHENATPVLVNRYNGVLVQSP